jgi:hypothetical protein
MLVKLWRVDAVIARAMAAYAVSGAAFPASGYGGRSVTATALFKVQYSNLFSVDIYMYAYTASLCCISRADF